MKYLCLIRNAACHSHVDHVMCTRVDSPVGQGVLKSARVGPPTAGRKPRAMSPPPVGAPPPPMPEPSGVPPPPPPMGHG